MKILIKTMPIDFTLAKFRSLCSAVAQHYPTMTLAEYFQGKDLPTRFAMMRHDIDRKPENALFTARVEAESGIRGDVLFQEVWKCVSSWDHERQKGEGARGRYYYDVRGRAKLT